jgi:hypothetical protein
VPLGLLCWTFLGLFAIVVLHELTHIAIARAFGHPLVCVAVNPVGVGVVFEDAPSPLYWAWQVGLPMLVTALASYVWLFGLFAIQPLPGTLAAQVGIVEQLPAVALVTALLTSGGDVLGLFFELRRPLHGEQRIRRDLRFLRRMPSVVHFTKYGRERWGSCWLEAHAEPVR